MSDPGWLFPPHVRGRSGLVPRPPWHFSSDVVVVDFLADPAALHAAFPTGVEPLEDGSASIVFGAWAAAADHDPRLSHDPARGQYMEAYVVAYGRHGTRRVGVVPHIWVDSDLALIRGNVQGFAKRYGAVSVSRPVSAGRGGPRRAPGGVFSAGLSSMGYHLADAEVRIVEAADRAPAAVATTLVLRRHLADLGGGAPVVDDYVTNDIRDFEMGSFFRGGARLELFESAYESLVDLAPREVTGGWVGSIGYTVIGQRRVDLAGSGADSDESPPDRVAQRTSSS